MRGRGGRNFKRKKRCPMWAKKTEREMVQGVRNGGDRFWGRDSHPLYGVPPQSATDAASNRGLVQDRDSEEYEEFYGRY